MSRGADLVLGTAGHIDHGKTALVRSLTGVELDALPEEQRRGITIALGFTDLELSDGRRVAIVDVPGHERLVRTMVSGATGIDAVLLCVSAVDGVMPQTREHLAILEVLGIEQAVVALTKVDLVDEELLELAQVDVEDALAGSPLEGAPVVPCSAVDGRGAERLVEVIATFERRSRDQRAPFRLPVDRAFVLSGFGTVVTGTVWEGQLETGATVQVLPAGLEARVRALQAHGAEVSRVEAGWRAAINLAGVDREQVGRGVVLSGVPLPCPHMVDVSYAHHSRAEPLEDGAAVQLLHGTQEILGRFYVAADREAVEPGERVYAQVRLDKPLPCRVDDRYVLRRPSPPDTLGGGRILDPWAPRMRRRDRVRAGKQLARLEAGERAVWLERADERGLDPAEWFARGGEGGAQLGDRVFAAGVAARLEGVLLEALSAYHNHSPLSLGPNRRELRRGRLAHLPDRVFDALVERMARTGLVQVDGPLCRLSSFEVELDSEQRRLRQAIEATIRAAGLGGITPARLHEAHPEPEVAALLRLIEADGVAEQVGRIGWVDRQALAELREGVEAWFQAHDRMSTGDFKAISGQSRRAAIPLLELFDARGWTRRVGDHRIAGG